jgi:hypothetical protein
MQSNDQDKTSPISSSTKDDELLTSAKRYGDYFPTIEEVCPRCHCSTYQTIKDTDGRDMRKCDSCHLHYLPSSERCPHCDSSDYRLTHGSNGQEIRNCKSCHLNYHPRVAH